MSQYGGMPFLRLLMMCRGSSFQGGAADDGFAGHVDVKGYAHEAQGIALQPADLATSQLGKLFVIEKQGGFHRFRCQQRFQGFRLKIQYGLGGEWVQR